MAERKSPVSKSTAVANWDEELAKQAEIAANMEANSGGGQFFGLKSGILTWQDAPLPGNQMAVVIVDSILENVYYEGKFDPEQIQSPGCFAFGRDEDSMEPHEKAQDKKCGQCKGCPNNEWGSADVGRGKACRNVRRLAMIPAGKFNKQGQFEMFEDVEDFEGSTIGFMKLPVTSVKGYASFVKQLAGTLRRPPHGVITLVRVVPDAKSQFKVLFEPITTVPNEFITAVMARNNEAKSIIDFPYSPTEDDARPKKSSKAKQPRKY